MQTLERIIELSHAISTLRSRRADVAAELARVDADLDSHFSELQKYVPGLTGSNGNGSAHGSFTIAGAIRKKGVAGYRKGSVAHRMLAVLADQEHAITGLELTNAVGVENKQVHAMLTRMVPNGHVAKEPGIGRSSKYSITELGREALANAKEGGPSDDAEIESTATND